MPATGAVPAPAAAPGGVWGADGTAAVQTDPTTYGVARLEWGMLAAGG
jgi:hypothetical protein